MNHPGLALGYRLEADGVALVYSTDHEPHSLHQPGAAGEHASAQPLPPHPEDRRHIDFLADADLVIHDAQYTLSEYPNKLGWGHSPAELAVDWALAAGAKRLALFHHDPLRGDEALDRLLDQCRERAASVGGKLDVFAAAEGQAIDLARPPAATAAAEPRAARAAAHPTAAPVSATVLIVDDEPDIVQLLTITLRSEGFRLLSANDGAAALAIARAERPDLILLDWNMPGASGLDVCRALRAEPDRHLRETPVVLVTGQAEAEDTAAGFAAGVTDYMTKPFKPAHVVSRVHAWLLRGRSRGD